MSEDHPGTPDTFFAPAARSNPAQLRRQRAAFISEPIAVALLDAMPGPAMVLNMNRQIVAINGVLKETLGVQDLDAVLGMRPGESVACIHATDHPGGCGTSRNCAECGAMNAILESMGSRCRATKECRIQSRVTTNGGAFDFRVHATFMTVSGQDFVVVGLEDISGEKRRRVLERTFFHDLLNTCGGVYGLAELLDGEENDHETEMEYKHNLHRLSGVVIDQIQSQRQLLSAERGELTAQARAVDVPKLLEEVVALYRHHEVCDGRTLRLESPGPGSLHTDPILAGRVLGNLIKNALEATPAGGTVTVKGILLDGAVAITVHNAGVIPVKVQLQIFQRSFSTKGGEGRGIGTYSVKLFTEQYLQGTISFKSNESEGTEFRVVIPNWQERRKAA